MRTTLAIVAALALAPLTGHAADKHDDGPVCTGGPTLNDRAWDGQKFTLNCDDGTHPVVTTFRQGNSVGWR
jgi:hypothetical protein